jgi:hypothetical protein
MTGGGGEESNRVEKKLPWERPTLTLLGNVTDLIRGSGKGSEGNEPDPPGASRKNRLIG